MSAETVAINAIMAAKQIRLARMIRLWVAANEIEHKALAEQWGASESTVTRFLKHGQMPNGSTMARIIAWLMEEGVQP